MRAAVSMDSKNQVSGFVCGAEIVLATFPVEGLTFFGGWLGSLVGGRWLPISKHSELKILGAR